MPLFIDIHEIAGATPEAVTEAHAADMACQAKYGVNYIKYWVNESRGKIFCLCVAPDAEAADRVHREAHGMRAERIIEVDPDMADTFLGSSLIAPTGAVMCNGGRLHDTAVRTIVFTDIVGSTALTQELGDRAAMRVIELHDDVVRTALQQHGGREVKHLGDGIMAAFDIALDAMRCAAAVHVGLGAIAREGMLAVRVRIGAAAGEPLERQGDFFGSTVQLAARLCAQAEPGQTLVSTDVTTLCPEAHFEDVGVVSLKGFAEPTRAHALVEA